MSIVSNFKKMAPGRKSLLIVGAVFFVVYFSLGVIFFFVKNLPFAMSPAMKTLFGAVLVAYSVFRMVRIVNGLKDSGS